MAPHSTSTHGQGCLTIDPMSDYRKVCTCRMYMLKIACHRDTGGFSDTKCIQNINSNFIILFF